MILFPFSHNFINWRIWSFNNNCWNFPFNRSIFRIGIRIGKRLIIFKDSKKLFIHWNYSHKMGKKTNSKLAKEYVSVLFSASGNNSLLSHSLIKVRIQTMKYDMKFIFLNNMRKHIFLSIAANQVMFTSRLSKRKKNHGKFEVYLRVFLNLTPNSLFPFIGFWFYSRNSSLQGLEYQFHFVVLLLLATSIEFSRERGRHSTSLFLLFLVYLWSFLIVLSFSFFLSFISDFVRVRCSYLCSINWLLIFLTIS